MAKALVINDLRHDGVDYVKGDTFDGDKEVVARLVQLGALRDPNAPADEGDSTDEAQAKAEAIVAEAEKVLADAKGEAESVVAQANAEADRIVKEAQVAAKKASESKTSTPSK